MTSLSDRLPSGGTGPLISYVIGAHNSLGVIEDTLEAIAKRLADVPAEIIVVENGSTDHSREMLEGLQMNWPDSAPTLRIISTQRGLGTALRAGIAATTGTIVVITADDLPFGFDDLDAAERLDIARVRVVIGSKAHPKSEIERSVVRAVLSSGHRVLRWLILGMRTADPQGTFVLHGDWARAIAPTLRETGFLITTEIAYAADLGGVHPVEVPVRLRKANHRTRVRLSDIGKMGVGLVGLRGRRAALRAAATAPLPR